MRHCIHRTESDGIAICNSDRIIINGPIPPGYCDRCQWRNLPQINERGVGDTVHSILHRTGVDRIVEAIGGCGGCGERKELLNRLLPYASGGDQAVNHVHCNHRETAISDPRRNLMMYLYPIAQHEVWRWNIKQIRQRMPLFNGKRIVTIATDEATNSADEVVSEFGDERIDEWIIGRNDPARWEMMGLPRMLSYCHSSDPNEITFYCHGKGVQGPAHVTDPLLREQPRIKWATVMYESCLDYMPLVERALERHTFAGSFKRRMTHGEKPFRSSWHFAGTFYWFRNCKLFGLPHWNVFNQQWYGAETYPGQLVGWYQAAGLFGSHAPIQYLVESWRDVIDPAWEAWKEANREYHQPCTIPS